MKLNKAITTTDIITRVSDKIIPCKKLQIDNIVFPKWSDLGLLGMIFTQKIKTKEQPDGCDYPEATYQVVMRILNGKVFMTGGRPDSYAWKQDKVLKAISNPSDIRLIGTNSASAVLNLAEILSTISDMEEKKVFADMFCSLNKDLLLVTTPEESRLCVEITSELYETGLTHCVDSWMTVDENGDADATALNIGDYLIIENENVYCIRHDEFVETHALTQTKV